MRYFLDPFGCAKNQVDAENMMACLDNAGWTAAADAEEADLIIVNSCGFIESAKQESINAVLLWRRRWPGKKILLAGCLSYRYADELAGSLPEADVIFGGADPAGIVDAAARCCGLTAARGKTAAGAASARPLLSPPGSAYVKISEGCDNRCSFCAIPLIRGRLRSRPIGDILEECRGLLLRGVKELCVIGQDIGSFGTDGSGGPAAGAAASRLPALLEAIASLEGRFWVRLLYIHPDHFPSGILDIMERDGRFLPYFDIPFQHASPKILSAMNRRRGAESCLALLETIRGRLSAAVIRSTFLLGFPGETDEDFALLLDFQEKTRADWLGCFTYSREEGTAAYAMKGQVSKKIALERKRIIEERQVSITGRNMDRFVGKTLDVLLEEQFENPAETEGAGTFDGGESLWLGRLYCQAPEVDGAAVIVCAEPELRGGTVSKLRPGAWASGKITARRGLDLELRLAETGY
ncbi:MAG: 30S ribosomal protein S12 methylthiotransferase RimO [Treponema sp.]|jgi:ribosomal protein S12 methylthiotransferase|nr:30S ribosomal protein S12 methylthiotransferase RimO [Treponema sp.]